MRHYLTVCHGWQLPVLLESMRRYCRPFSLHVLAWDFSPPHELGGVDVSFVTREAFLRENPLWAELPGPPRLPVDVVATMRWQMLARLVERHGPVTMIDGDQWFWSSPEAVYAEIGDAKLAASPHRFPRKADGLPGVSYESHRRYGIYNTGWVYCADAEIAGDLAERNRRWSYSNRPDEALYGDQGHFEIVADEVGAHVVEHPGLNVAPWNAHRYETGDLEGHIGVGEHVGGRYRVAPLISYHYSSMRFDVVGRVTQWADPGYEINQRQIDVFYRPYAEAMQASFRARLVR